MSKAKIAFEDYLTKLGRVVVPKHNVIMWSDFEAMCEARDTLERYLEPPRNKKGYFLPISKPDKASRNG